MIESHPDFFFETVDETPKNGTRDIQKKLCVSSHIVKGQDL